MSLGGIKSTSMGQPEGKDGQNPISWYSKALRHEMHGKVRML